MDAKLQKELDSMNMSLEDILREVGLGCGQRGLEVGWRGPLALMQTGFDMQGKGVPAPTVGDGLANIPKAGFLVLDLIHENTVVEPG